MRPQGRNRVYPIDHFVNAVLSGKPRWPIELGKIEKRKGTPKSSFSYCRSHGFRKGYRGGERKMRRTLCGHLGCGRISSQRRSSMRRLSQSAAQIGLCTLSRCFMQSCIFVNIFFQFLFRQMVGLTIVDGFQPCEQCTGG